jgi:hypothetical protein
MAPPDPSMALVLEAQTLDSVREPPRVLYTAPPGSSAVLLANLHPRAAGRGPARLAGPTGEPTPIRSAPCPPAPAAAFVS